MSCFQELLVQCERQMHEEMVSGTDNSCRALQEICRSH